MGWTTEELWLDSWQGWEIFLFSSVKTSCVTHHIPIQWVLGTAFPGVKTSDIEAHNLPFSTAKDMNVWSCTSTFLCVPSRHVQGKLYMMLTHILVTAILWICLALAPVGLIPDSPYSFLAGDEHVNLCSAQLHFCGTWWTALLSTHCCDLLKPCSILSPPPRVLNFPLYTFWKISHCFLASLLSVCSALPPPGLSASHWHAHKAMTLSPAIISCLYFSYAAYCYTLKMEAVCCFKTVNFYQTLWYHTSEHGNLYILLFHCT